MNIGNASNDIHHIHIEAMLNKKRGLEGKFAQQYVKLGVTSLLLHVHVTVPIHVEAMLKKARLGRQVRTTIRKTLHNIIVTSRSCDVTLLFRHLLYDALFTKTRLGRQA